jgi:thioredoxin-related protein
MKFLFGFLAALPLVAAAQRSIRFEQTGNWKQVVSEARTENKYIFVYCFTPSSERCRQMDREVYTNEKVAELFNTRFISMKLEMDGSAQAKDIQRRYHIVEYPSFLFFSPAGEIMHKSLGFTDADGLIQLANEALDSHKQYYTLLQAYRLGETNYPSMPYLANTAWAIKEKAVGNAVSRDYVNGFLWKLPEDQLYSKEHIEFMAAFLINSDKTSSKKVFDLFYKNRERIDSITGKKYSRDIIDFVISKEEIDSRLWTQDGKDIAEKPNWEMITAHVSSKYNADYAMRTVLAAQIRWYEYKKDSNELVKYNVEKVEKYGLDTAGFGKIELNNMIYYILFRHSNDTAVLGKAIKWMDVIVTSEPDNPAFLDTYANLLYKTGRSEDALRIEQKALSFAQDKDIQDNYAKMKRGELTWDPR